MIWIIILIIVFTIIILVLGNTNKPKKASMRSPIKGKRVLTMNEQPTFLRLREALPEHIILAQVAFSAFMTAQGYATRNLFNRKVADFVVLDKQFNIVAVVELDDSSHRGKEDKDAHRDSLIVEAGYRIIRYARTPDIEQIKQDFGVSVVEATTIETENPEKTAFVAEAFVFETETKQQKGW